jgi:hypothetical protein
MKSCDASTCPALGLMAACVALQDEIVLFCPDRSDPKPRFAFVTISLSDRLQIAMEWALEWA